MTTENKPTNTLRHEEQVFVRQSLANGYKQCNQGLNRKPHPEVVRAIALIPIERNSYTDETLTPKQEM